jgi:hypothetical protein
VTSVRVRRRSTGVLSIALAIVTGAVGLTALIGAGGSDAPAVAYAEGLILLAGAIGCAMFGLSSLRRRA